MNRKNISPQNPDRDELRLLTVADAAVRLGLSVKTLANWRSAGQGPRFVKIRRGDARGTAGAIRYDVRELERFCSANTHSSTSTVVENGNGPAC